MLEEIDQESRCRVFLSWRRQSIGIEIKMCKSAQKAIDRTGVTQKSWRSAARYEISCRTAAQETIDQDIEFCISAHRN